MADFHLCWTSKSNSQANIFTIALCNKLLSEFAFAHLCYFLRGDRPSQTTFHKLSSKKIK
jgi:hypothetical protein